MVSRSSRGAVGKIAKMVTTAKPMISPTPIIAVKVWVIRFRYPKNNNNPVVITISESDSTIAAFSPLSATLVKKAKIATNERRKLEAGKI